MRPRPRSWGCYGTPIGFCCSACPSLFVKDPEHYLSLRRIRLRSALDSTRRARLEPAYRAAVNHELYYFADSSLRRRFQANPLAYCGIVTDPVSRGRFRPTARSARTEFQGRPYFFRNRMALEIFSAMPDSFANRRGM